MTIRIMIVDDHSVVRQGLCSFLVLDPEIKVVGEAANGTEALQLSQKLEPDVILMDLMMPGMDGFAATSAIKQKLPKTNILILTGNLDLSAIAKGLNSGASGYILKNMEADELCHSIKTVSTGQILLSPQVAEMLAQQNTEKHNTLPAENLTDRETDVLRLLSQGKTNKEIAYILKLSEKTIKIHVSIILAKLGMQSRTQAALYAVSMGLLPEENQQQVTL